jgi:hypothetical protein
MLERPISVMRAVASQFEDATSLEAIEAYFNELYDVQGDGVDAENIVRSLDGGSRAGSFPFAAIAQKFKLIGENTRPIVIPYDEKAEAMIERLKAGERSRGLLRGIQPYTVNVYPGNYEALRGSLLVLDEDETLVALADMNKYGDKTGLDASTDGGKGIFV